MAQQKETGFCKFFNTEKGFGFITPDAGGDDLFVHQTSIHAEGFRSLAEGEKVEYDREMNHEKGKEKAVNVTGPGGVHVKGQPKQQNNDRGYNDRGNSRGYNDRGNSRGYNDQGSRGYNDQGSQGYNNQGSRGYNDQNSGYGDRSNQGYNNQQY